MKTYYVTIKHTNEKFKNSVGVDVLCKLIKMGRSNIIIEQNDIIYEINYKYILSINVISLDFSEIKRSFILLNSKWKENDEFDLDYLYEIIMVNDDKSMTLITKSKIYNDKIVFDKNKSYLMSGIKDFIIYEEGDIFELINMGNSGTEEMKKSDQYCYVDVEHRDDIINKTITNSYLKLIGLENDSYVFWNFNEDGIFKLEIDKVKSIKINAIVNHNQNPNYVFVSQIFDKIPDEQLLNYIYEVIFCSEDNSVALLCKTNIVNGNICFNGNDVFLIRNINDFKLYKKEDVLNMTINEKSADYEFDDIKMISFEDFKHEYSKAIRKNFVVIIKHIAEQINSYFEDFCDGVIYDVCLFELKFCENDKKVFLENDGFEVLKTILSKNGWVVEEIEFHNDGPFLTITFKL